MKKTTFTIIMAIVMVTSLLGGYFSAPAMAQLALLAYGGQVLMANPALCSCSANVYILYRPAFPTILTVPILAYSPAFTLLHAWYNVFGIGVWHKGQFVPGIQSCYMYVGYGCVVIPTTGIIFQMGTSLTPGKL